MSGISLNIDVQGGQPPALRAVLGLLADRTGLHDAIARRATTLTRDHLIRIASSRHATASRLGARPSGHWAQAAEKTTFSADSLAATITIAQPGIGRAMHDVDIYPGAGAKCLTIPLIAEAYNLRAADVWESEQLVVAKSKQSGKAFAGKRLEDGSFQAWYLLVPSVHQHQDRTLLPSDDEYRVSALEGAHDYLSYLLTRS